MCHCGQGSEDQDTCHLINTRERIIEEMLIVQLRIETT